MEKSAASYSNPKGEAEPKVTSDKDKKVIEQLFKERDSYQSASTQTRQDINDIYQAYVGEIDDVKDRSKSQEKINKLRTEVNYIVPSIFSGNPELEVEPIGEEDKDLAQVLEEIVNYRLQTTCQAYEKIEAWVKQSVVFGTSLLNVVWKFEKKDNGDGTESPVKDEPDFQVPNILDCFYNPIIPDVEGQKSVIFRSVLSLEEVKENPAYENTDKLQSKASNQSDTFNSSKQVQSDRINLQKASEGTIEVYERITSDRIQTVADGKERVLLRDVENPYDYYTMVKLIHEPNAIPNRFDGFGAGHNTMGLGKLIQKFANRLTDNANLANTPAFMFKKGAGIDKKQLNIKAGGGIEVDGEGPIRDNIAQVEVADITTGGLALLNRFDDEHRRATGATELLQGAASNKTLGQDELASTYASNRFELITRRFKQALADIGRILIFMEVQNIQSINAPILKIFPLEAELQGGKIRYSRETVYQFLLAARERADLDFNIRIKGETNIARNKDILLKQFAEWYNLFGPILPPENQLAAAKKWLELRGIDEVDKLVPDPEMMQEQMQVQQGMPQPMGATPPTVQL